MIRPENDDDLFLNDIGDLSQIYRAKPRSNRNHFAFSRFKRTSDLSRRNFDDLYLQKKIGRKSKEVRKDSEFRREIEDEDMHGDGDIFAVESDLDRITEGVRARNMKENSNSPYFPNPDSSEIEEDVPWRKNKPNNPSLYEFNIADFEDDSNPPGVEVGSDNHTFSARNSEETFGNIRSLEIMECSSAELLDENYPNLNTVEKPKLKPLRFTFDKKEGKTKEEKSHSKKNHHDDDDVVIIDNTSPVQNSSLRRAGRSSRFDLTNSVTAVKSGSQIPVLNMNLESNPPFQAQNPVPNAPSSLFSNCVIGYGSNSYSQDLPPFDIPPPSYEMSFLGNPPPPTEFFNHPPPARPIEIPEFDSRRPPPNHWITSVNSTNSQPPLIRPNVHDSFNPREDSRKMQKLEQDDPVKNEIYQQNMSLMAQRDTYLKKYSFLSEELEKLKKQKNDLLENKRDHQVENVLKTNEELQIDIQSKMKGVKNVIDMLSKIIKDDEEPRKSIVKNDHDEKKDNSSKSNRDKKSGRCRSRSKSKSKTRNKSRTRSKGRKSGSRSRSHSPKRHRRRSHSRDKYQKRRSPVKHSKNPDKDRDKEKEKTKIEEKIQKAINKELAVTKSKRDLQLDKTVNDDESNTKCAVEKTEEKTKTVYLENLQEIRITEEKRLPSVNYVYYDPEVHWCQICDVFPRTAKEYLLHLHDKHHKDELAKRNVIEYPWHKSEVTETKPPHNPDAPTEKIPIRGLPFFVSATAWYCKLCSAWMGDMHCASSHLKSVEHAHKYKEFVEMNPLWEETWSQNRSKALELYSRSQADQGVFTCAVPPDRPTPSASHEDARTYLQRIRAMKQVVSPSAKKRSTSKSTSSSSSSSSSGSNSSDSSDSNSNRKKKSKKSKSKKKEREKKQKLKSSIKSRDQESSNKASELIPLPTLNKKEDDKFVKEWMNNVRSRSKEREFQELKSKLKRKEAEEKAKSNAQRGSNNDTKKDADKEKIQSKEKPDLDKEEEKKTVNKKMLTKPITIGKPTTKFPFIGKMPSKNPKKKVETNDKSQISVATTLPATDPPSKPEIKKGNSDELSATIKKQLEEMERQMEGELDTTVVDMDINDDESEGVGGVIDDNDCRKKDFEETLKILYPEEQRPVCSVVTQQVVPQFSVPPMLHSQPTAGMYPPQPVPSHLTQDYLISLIESTLIEKFKTGFHGQMENPAQFVELMSQNMMSSMTQGSMVYQMPPLQQQQEVMLPMNSYVNGMTEVIEPPGTEQTLQSLPIELPELPSDEPQLKSKTKEIKPKKKRNPISQKKRRHLAKLRKKLEEQEKQLQAKIEETEKHLKKVQMESEETEVIPQPVSMNIDSDLLLLGIDEGDSAALQF